MFCSIGVNLLLLCMLWFKRAFYLAFFLLLCSCTKNEFNLVFNLDENITDNYNVTYYASSVEGGLTVQSVASVMKGKCQLKGITKLPTLVYITARRSSVPLVVYVEKGSSIDISGDSNQPFSWKATPGAINDSISKWRFENIEAFESKNQDEINSAVADYIVNHPSDPASLIILMSYFQRSDNEFQYIDLMSKMEVPDKENWIKLIGRADQLNTMLATPGRIENMVVRSSLGGTDTIRFDGEKPGFVLFWQNDLKERKTLIDSLKVLVKEFPDSSSRIIADINLDADSVIWKNSLKRDSLNKVMRLWSPAGLGDKAVMKLKVSAIPYFIVFDKNGNQSYRGIEIEEAMEKFRNIYNEKDSVAG